MGNPLTIVVLHDRIIINHKERVLYMASFGMKAQVKSFLKSKGVKDIQVGSRRVKLANAKTIDLITVASKLGY